MEFVFNDFLVHNKVDGVLLAASWKDEDLPVLSATLRSAESEGIDVTVLGPIVEYDAALPRLLVDGILHDTPSHREREADARHSRAGSGHEADGDGHRRDLSLGLRCDMP